jgi:hypothetical protein
MKDPLLTVNRMEREAEHFVITSKSEWSVSQLIDRLGWEQLMTQRPLASSIDVA